MNDEIGHHESSSRRTNDPRTIRNWAESRAGRPALLRDARRPGEELRILFGPPGEGSGNHAEPITWDEFFLRFTERKLSFLYQERTKDGEISRFCRIVEQ